MVSVLKNINFRHKGGSTVTVNIIGNKKKLRKPKLFDLFVSQCCAILIHSSQKNWYKLCLNWEDSTNWGTSKTPSELNQLHQLQTHRDRLKTLTNYTNLNQSLCFVLPTKYDGPDTPHLVRLSQKACNFHSRFLTRWHLRPLLLNYSFLEPTASRCKEAQAVSQGSQGKHGPKIF